MKTSHDMERLAKRDPKAWLAVRAREREVFIRSWRDSLPTYADNRETYEQFADGVALEAPRDLESLGVPMPFLAWQRAVAYLRDQRVLRLETFFRQLYQLAYDSALAVRYDLYPGTPARDFIADLNAEIALGMPAFARRYLPLALQRLRHAQIADFFARHSISVAASPQK